jgi:hypothetical protein
VAVTDIHHQPAARRPGMGFPALLVAFQWVRARRTPTRLQATGPVGHASNPGGM